MSALQIANIAAAIAGLSVSGVTIKDIDEIPESLDNRDCPILFPQPRGFVSNFRVTRESAGVAGTALKTAYYTLTYTFAYRAITAERGLFDSFDDTIDKAYEVLDAIIGNDALSSAVDLEPEDVVNFGPVSDPSGALFHGCEIRIRITEYI